MEGVGQRPSVHLPQIYSKGDELPNNTTILLGVPYGPYQIKC